MRNLIHILLAISAHYTYLWAFPKNRDEAPAFSASILTLLLWSIELSIMVFFFYRLDLQAERSPVVKRHPRNAEAPPYYTGGFRLIKKKYGGDFVKLTPPLTASKSAPAEPSFWEQLPIVARNFGLVFFLQPGILLIGSCFGRTYERAEKESLLGTFCWVYIHYITADLLFYGGHWLMHRSRWLFLETHALHHKSLALCSIAGYYMTLVDFFLEHSGAFWSFMFWGECGAHWPVAILVGAYNLIWTHSGYDHPWGPNPYLHWMHHAKHRVEYGIFYDHVFGTGVEAFGKGYSLKDKAQSAAMLGVTFAACLW